MIRTLGAILLSMSSLLVAACGDDGGTGDQPDAMLPDQAVTIPFRVELGGAPFACGAAVANQGRPAVTFTATDARFYVHDVELVDADGARHPVTLAANAFQGQGIALLDFEDGCGSDGTPQLHTSITGTVAGGTHTGVRFTLGVPADHNFIDLASAAPPLDVTGMFWIWQFGYKFLKLDGSTPGTGGAGSSPFFLHLGSSGCPGSNFEAPPTGPCAYPNQVTYELSGFDASRNTVVADLGAVLSASDLTVNTPDTAPGCMSEPADPECITILPRLGVNGAATQTLFRVQ